MRLLRGAFDWGLCPQTPRIYRFFLARMDVFDCFQGTGATCPPPFRPLSRSLGLLPSIALSRPAQVLPGWTTSTSPCNTFLANGDYPLNFVSHSRGSLQRGEMRPSPFPLRRGRIRAWFWSLGTWVRLFREAWYDCVPNNCSTERSPNGSSQERGRPAWSWSRVQNLREELRQGRSTQSAHRGSAPACYIRCLQDLFLQQGPNRLGRRVGRLGCNKQWKSRGHSRTC